MSFFVGPLSVFATPEEVVHYPHQKALNQKREPESGCNFKILPQFHQTPLKLFIHPVVVKIATLWIGIKFTFDSVLILLAVHTMYQRVPIELKQRYFVWHITDDDFPLHNGSTRFSPSPSVPRQFGAQSAIFSHDALLLYRQRLSQLNPMTVTRTYSPWSYYTVSNWERNFPNQSLLRISWNFLWCKTPRPELDPGTLCQCVAEVPHAGHT